jgi:hypothetical protein
MLPALSEHAQRALDQMFHQADQLLGQVEQWERHGALLNCPVQVETSDINPLATESNYQLTFSP